MRTQILITIYLMICSYFFGRDLENEKTTDFIDNKIILYLVFLVIFFIYPVYYLYEFIKFILVEIRKYFLLWGWWKYYTDKSFGKNFSDKEVLYLKYRKPKHKLEALFIKKILKRIDIK